MFKSTGARLGRLCTRDPFSSFIKQYTGRSLRIQSNTLRGSLIPTGTRTYASSSKRKPVDDSENVLSPKTIFLVGVIGTAIFVKAVDSLDKKKPKLSYSDVEFEEIVDGLRRKVTIFKPGEINVYFALFDDVVTAKENLGEKAQNYQYINPREVVDQHRLSAGDEDRYKALLENIYAKYGEDFMDHLPHGLLVALLGAYMKEHVSQGANVVIVNFPRVIHDAIDFEGDVCTVARMIAPKTDKEVDVCKYYETVNRITFV